LINWLPIWPKNEPKAMSTVRVFAPTKKGAFILIADDQRQN
jgi:hypothetical protein